ncbi:hypothetical protein [Evansella halocellulosilytica]|uniref:hypothetical protein n=1 Tax=Evansella halocellulosilytica TaxID=2011013 RepID=UPI0011554F8C|nr:hypothetical protein [Evansella halocellulosilytica]
MMKFILEASDETLSTHSGLGLISLLLSKTELSTRLTSLNYIGQEGYVVNVELREGKTHVQKDTDVFLKESIRYAKELTNMPLLVRADGGNDRIDNLKVCV